MDDILLQVNKPGRYIAGEWNSITKDFANSQVKFAICFPDLYEVGMSNLGIRIIYGLLNSIPDVACERFFSPAQDMENHLRKLGQEICSLESKKKMSDFDMVGFSLGSELLYTNVLNLLDLGGIPLKARLRTNADPLVIGGGPCALNPEPMHEFFDLFIIGEAEKALLEVIEAYRSNKAGFKASKISRQDLLFILSGIKGVYVPSFYEARHHPSGLLEKFHPVIEGAPDKINKRIVEDFNSSFFPCDWIIPYLQIVHDRISLEIMRGCPNRCRFCQSRSQYFPYRQREVGTAVNLAKQAFVKTGYEEIALSGLSVSDFRGIEELSQELVSFFKEKAVAVSLPSIKAKIAVGNISSMIASIKKTGLTFAPEAGTDALRSIIAKDFNEQDFFRVLEEAFLSGYRLIKLYFMIGLPCEKKEDLDSIIGFSLATSEARKKLKKNPALVNISINTLIPKPHTSLQWLDMIGIDQIREKQDYLKEKSKNNRLKLSFHDRYMSFVEGVLSRGDRRLSEVIYRAFLRGARFDAWMSHFSFEKWVGAFKETGIDPEFYLRKKSQEEALPWDFISVGIDKNNLKAEYNKVLAIERDKGYN
ncbi:MAG: TIGR03960 family B12-binding radical SAM protein [Candidatus Omnitrophota bacterium]